MSNSVQNGNKTSKSEDSTSKDALAENQTPTILDNRLGTFVQKKLGEPMNQNFRSQKTAQLQTIIGGQAPVQRAVDEEDLQTKAKPVQKVGIGENIQQPTAPYTESGRRRRTTNEGCSPSKKRKQYGFTR